MSLGTEFDNGVEGFVTVTVADQVLGVELSRVGNVFVPQGLSVVPLAPPNVAGLLNLRGRIVTALDLRALLDLPPRAEGRPAVAIGIEKGGDLYGLIADGAGEVLWIPASRREAAPTNLDSRWADACSGICRLDDGLLMVLDVDGILDFGQTGAAA